MDDAMGEDPPELDATQMRILEQIDRVDTRIKSARERCPDAPFIR